MSSRAIHPTDIPPACCVSTTWGVIARGIPRVLKMGSQETCVQVYNGTLTEAAAKSASWRQRGGKRLGLGSCIVPIKVAGIPRRGRRYASLTAFAGGTAKLWIQV